MYSAFGLFIDGSWSGKPVGTTTEVIDPATGEVLGVVPAATVDDAQAAIMAADRAFLPWAHTLAWDRADLLHKVAHVMATRALEASRQITLETGKPRTQSAREWGLAVDQFRWYAEEARRTYGRIVETRVPNGRFEITHEPVGVVAAFTAWNFPAALIARKVAPALAAGCSVIVRPSAEVPGVAMIIFDCLREAGIPAGVANLLIGPTSSTYKPIMASPIVRKISLTGSTQVGQQMIRDSADTVKRVSMELGGNAPMIVFDDADLEKTLDLAVTTKYANAGQVCVTPDRFYIHESIHDRFVKGFAHRARNLKLGHGLQEDSQMGPLINHRRLTAIEEIVEDARARGGHIVAGGKRPDSINAGFFFEPTVISGLSDDAQALAGENFGPVAAITPFTEKDDVFQRANASEMGLSAYVFTTNLLKAREAVATLAAGMVGVNTFALAAAEAPFGGIKASGMGREGGTEGILDYVNVKLAQIVI